MPYTKFGNVMKESNNTILSFLVCKCNRKAFWLKNAPATFERLMERCMGEFHLSDCFICLDKVLIYSYSFESHFQRLRAVFNRLEP